MSDNSNDQSPPPVMPKVKIRRRRKNGSNPNSPKLYFNENTQAAIVAYQSATTKKERDTLYVTEILPAFSKLVENLINIHKFTGLFDSFDDLKNDCVNFLFETIFKFDASRGTAAFSYFNVVAKNWLIVRTKQKSLRMKRNVSIDDLDLLTQSDIELIEDHTTLQSQEAILETLNQTTDISNLLYEVHHKVHGEHEEVCMNAIKSIFKDIDKVDLLNKSAVLLYMRELTGLSPKQLTAAMQIIKKHYVKSRYDAQNKP